MITTLKPNEVFVYGANRAWRHGSGAARTALKWGAIYGEGPFRGQTYGICTKDERINTLPLSEIAKEIDAFVAFARTRPDLTFLLTPVGTGFAGLSAKDMAPLFTSAPPNVIIPAAFLVYLSICPPST